MIVGVADTHTALWHLYGDPRLSAAADVFLMGAAASGHKIAVSSISFIEVVYLVDKGRMMQASYDALQAAVADPEHLFVEVPVSAQVAEAMRQVSRAEVPDMPDRIVAATALRLSVPVISRDRRVRAARLTTIW
jgi:PIN domain nuclease of toxin-antitoxin system